MYKSKEEKCFRPIYITRGVDFLSSRPKPFSAGPQHWITLLCRPGKKSSALGLPLFRCAYLQFSKQKLTDASIEGGNVPDKSEKSDAGSSLRLIELSKNKTSVIKLTAVKFLRESFRPREPQGEPARRSFDRSGIRIGSSRPGFPRISSTFGTVLSFLPSAPWWLQRSHLDPVEVRDKIKEATSLGDHPWGGCRGGGQNEKSPEMWSFRIFL